VIPLAATIVGAVVVGVGAEHRYQGGARAVSERVLWIGLWIVLPVVAFINLNVLELDVKVGAGIAYGWCAVATSLAITYLMARFVLRVPRPTTGGMLLVSSWGNTGYLGLPLTIGLFGADALPSAIAYDVLVSGFTFVTVGFGLAAVFGTGGHTLAASARAFIVRNPPLWASLAGLLMPHSFVPDWLVDASHVLVIAIVPIGFFVVGVMLATVAEEGAAAFPPPLTAPLATATAVKCLVSPAVVLLLSTFVLHVPHQYVTQAAVGSGLMSLAVAQAYGLDRGIVAGTIAVTTTITLVWGLVVALL
jgi:predicted permease